MAMTNPQSWNDFPRMDPMDPRLVIQKLSFDDNTGVGQGASFAWSSSWLQAVTWVNPVLKVSDITGSTTPTIAANSAQDYQSFQEAIVWNSTKAMVTPNPKLPLAVKKIVFLKAGIAFDNLIFLDWIGVTSTDVQISFRDNSVTSGTLDAGGSLPVIPVFQLPSSTFGGTGRRLTVTILRPGRYAMAIRVRDSAGNYSMFEMDWIAE